MISAKVVKVDIPSNAAEEFLKKLDAGLTDVADVILTRSQELVAVDEGMLKKSGHIEDEFLDKSVVYDMPYADDVEFGAEPHKPLFEDIRAWVHRKRADFGIKPSEVNWVARQVQAKIEERGTNPQPFLRPAFAEGESRAAEIIRGKFVH